MNTSLDLATDNVSKPINIINHHKIYSKKYWYSWNSDLTYATALTPSRHRLVRSLSETSQVKRYRYDAINKCKSAGVIPYAIYQGALYFLFQKTIKPVKKKNDGWNDFGGKHINPVETTADIAAREFSEETSCLFYLKEKPTPETERLYELLKDNELLHYDDTTVESLKELIQLSQRFYSDRITEFVLPIHISSKETYISYFVKVNYLPATDIPKAEDIHIPYEDRYIRTCKWFSFDELMSLNDNDFHPRLKITKIQQRINNYFDKGLFV